LRIKFLIQDFLHTTLGKTGIPVHRLGLSATYYPGKKTIYKAIDEGINFFFAFGVDVQMVRTLRDVIKKDREKYIISTGAYNLLLGHPNIQRSLEKRLRQLKTEYIDIFNFLGVTKEKHMPESLIEEFQRLKETGKVRFIGLSTHQRKFAGKLAAKGALDVFMIRYNAAHRGAEEDIFPYLKEHNPGVVSYTSTRWRFLIRKPKGWPKDGRIPTPGECYRFVLTNPNVHVCVSAPSNYKHFEENLNGVKQGPLNEEDMEFMKKFGDVVHHTKKWFM
jgi:aryl-alcohol dehydrogenase-like predicted oxidoreductase